MAHGIFEVTYFLGFVFKVDNLRIKCVNPLLSEDFNFLLFSPLAIETEKSLSLLWKGFLPSS